MIQFKQIGKVSTIIFSETHLCSYNFLRENYMYTNTTANHGVLTIHATRDVIVLIKLSAQIISAYCNPVLIKLRQQRTEVE